ncbi:hypothetical protein [Streptomyces sp. NPDC000983]|uniref:hypothetical protein n=1 Tax=Streptomyces sp. NPDC000983 TaxID=3154373 RepID=UPI00332C262E
MTDDTAMPRVPDRPERVTMLRTEPSPDGSTVLTLLVPGPLLVMNEHRFALDPQLTWALLHNLNRDLDGMTDPGPRPEVTTMLEALRTGDRAAFSAALDDYNQHILNLWTDQGADA